jgi:hypothetical protein
MAASVDLDEDSTYLLNKYFILPVLSLNTSVMNLDSTVNSFNNSSSVIANTSSITILNASVLANTSSITNLNSSVNASIADINISITGIKSSASILNTSVSNLSNYVTNINTSVTTLNTSVSNLSNYITNINTSVTILNTSIFNLSNYVTNFNTSFNNAIDLVSSTTLTIGGTNGTSTQSYAGSLTSGTLNIGNSQTNGILNIGTGNARSGAINIATVTGSTCPINILNGGGATTGGSVNIANGSFQTTTINIASGNGGTGTVSIGNISNTTTLGSASINVNGNLIMEGSKKIQTANLDALSAGGTVELANSNAGAVYIGASGVRNVINNIGTGSGTGSINLGNATNVINMYGNLIMGTGRNITLQPPAGYVAPSSNTQLGFSAGLPGISFSSGVTTGNTIYCYSPPNGTVQNFLVAGVYLMSGYAFAYFSGTVTSCSVQLDIAIVGGSATPSGTGVANGLFNTRISPFINTPTGDTRSFFPTYTFTVVTHQYYYISCGASFVSITGGGTVTCGVQLLSLVRIA